MSLLYLVKFRSCSLAVYNNKFKLVSNCICTHNVRNVIVYLQIFKKTTKLPVFVHSNQTNSDFWCALEIVSVDPGWSGYSVYFCYA